jgi:hypothetical protein
MVAKGSEERYSTMLFIVLAVQLSRSVRKLLMGSHQRKSHQRMLVQMRR